MLKWPFSTKLRNNHVPPNLEMTKIHLILKNVEITMFQKIEQWLCSKKLRNDCVPPNWQGSNPLSSTPKLNPKYYKLRPCPTKFRNDQVPPNQEKWRNDHVPRNLQKTVPQLHYLDLSTQPNEQEKLLTSNIHILSPQK